VQKQSPTPRLLKDCSGSIVLKNSVRTRGWPRSDPSTRAAPRSF